MANQLKQFTKSFSLLILVLLYNGCGRSASVKSAAGYLTVREIVMLYPAENPAMQVLLNNALYDRDVPAMYKLCVLLADTSGELRTKAQYAISAIAQDVRSAYKQLMERAILKALDTSLPVEQKKFLLEQLHMCGSNTSIGQLSDLMDDRQLSEPAIQTLRAIGSPECAERMLERYNSVAKPVKISILKNLGELYYRPAGEKIFAITGSDDEQIKSAAMHALADLGYAPAEELFRAGLQVRDINSRLQTAFLYLKFLEKTGNDDLRRMRCREIMHDKSWPDNIRIHAIKIQLEKNGSRVLPEIHDVIVAENAAVKAAAFQLMIPLKDPETDAFWLNELRTGTPSEIADIIRLFGWQNHHAMFKTLIGYLDDDDETVRIATISALSATDPSTAARFLIGHLTNNLTVIEKEALFNALLRLPVEHIEESLPEIWERGSGDIRLFIARLIAERQIIAMNHYLTSALTAQNETFDQTVLETLSITGGRGEFETILEFGLKVGHGSLKNSAAKTLIAILTADNEGGMLDSLLSKKFDSADNENKLWMMGIMRYSGDPALFHKIADVVNGPDKKSADEAFNTLTNWQTDDVIDMLIAMIEDEEQMRKQVLAWRGAFRLVRKLEPDTAVQIKYYRKLLSLAERDDERRMVFGGISEIPNRAAIQLLIPYAEHPEVGNEAKAAIIKILSARDQNQDGALELAALLLPELFKNDRFPGSGPDSRAAGFQPLFNGEDLEGWQGRAVDPPEEGGLTAQVKFDRQLLADSLMQVHWTVKNGILHFDGGGKNICTRKIYRNFELFVDWMIEPGSDSGIYLRGVPQVQIWDIREHPEGSGGLYNNKVAKNTPLIAADKPPGEWNRFRILMVDERVTVYLNDFLVVENVPLENYWEPGMSLYSTGPVELQAHMTPVYFRNIFIRELEGSGTGHTVRLFNGRDLTGWKQVAGRPESWFIRDSLLVANPEGSGWLSSNREYSDFRLEVQFRVPPGGNSGIFLRSPQEGDPAFSGIEIQLLDDYAAQYADLKPWQYTGSAYAISAPTVLNSKPAGEWQDITIQYIGPHLQVVLNDRIINNIDLIDHMYRETVHPGIKRRKGFIGLQNHGSEVEFRNISITEIFEMEN